jgi:hypothetical protein
LEISVLDSQAKGLNWEDLEDEIMRARKISKMFKDLLKFKKEI